MTTRHFPTRRQVLLGAVAGVAGIVGRRSNRQVAFMQVVGSDTNFGAEVRLQDSSQTPPAGQYRLRVEGDFLYLERALAADFGGSDFRTFVTYDHSQPFIGLRATGTTAAQARLAADNNGGSDGDGAYVFVGASTAIQPGYLVQTGNGSTQLLARFAIPTGAAEVIAALTNMKLNYGTGYPTQTTVGAAGAASALPATPTGYLRIQVAGAERIIPFYAQA